MLKDRSPSACASKSYNATTYSAGGAIGLGLGFRGGGGGGALFAPAAAAAALAPLDALYGGGGFWCAPSEGGGGGAFLKEDALEAARDGGGTLEETEFDEEVVAEEAERPRPLGPAPKERFPCTILAGKNYSFSFACL